MSNRPKFCTGLRNFKQDVKATGIGKFHFTKSEWSNFHQLEKVSVPYMVWRVVFMSFFVYAVINSIVAPQPAGAATKYWLIYLTNWSLFTQMIYGILFFIDNLIACSCPDRAKKNQISTSPKEAPLTMDSATSDTDTNSKSVVDQDPEPNVENEINNSSNTAKLKNFKRINYFQTVIWGLLNITGTLPVFVTLGYWLTVYDPKVDGPKIPDGRYNVFMVHGVNAVFAIIDTMVIALPVRVSHFVYLVAHGFTYILFSIVFEVGIGVYPNPSQPFIYPLLNWRQQSAMTVIACVVALLVYGCLHVSLWFRYIFRLYLVSKISCRNDKANVYDYHHYDYTQTKISGDSKDGDDGTNHSASNLTSEASNVPEPTSQSLTEVISDSDS